MTDIVEDLQPYAVRSSILVGTPPELLRRACDEIEQLRTRLDRAESKLKHRELF